MIARPFNQNNMWNSKSVISTCETSLTSKFEEKFQLHIKKKHGRKRPILILSNNYKIYIYKKTSTTFNRMERRAIIIDEWAIW